LRESERNARGSPGSLAARNDENGADDNGSGEVPAPSSPSSGVPPPPAARATLLLLA